MFIFFLKTKIKKARVSMLFRTYTLFHILQLALMHAYQGIVYPVRRYCYVFFMVLSLHVPLKCRHSHRKPIK